jgi:hypothetical protein
MPASKAERQLAASRRRFVIERIADIFTDPNGNIDSESFGHWNVVRAAFRPQLDATIDRLTGIGDKPDLDRHLLVALLLHVLERLL